MGCGCGKPSVIKTRPKSALKSSGNFSNISQFGEEELKAEQLVQVEYLGVNEGKFSVRSRVLPGKSYRFGNNIHHKIQTVFLRDAEFLVAQTDRDGYPIYRIVTGGTIEQRDPTSFLGRAVTT